VKSPKASAKVKSPKASPRASPPKPTPPSPNIAPPRVPPHHYNAPFGVFRPLNTKNENFGNRHEIESPGFRNARPLAMLERGWRVMNTDEFDVKLEGGFRRKTELLNTDILVLISEYDGPEYEAKLISFQAGSSMTKTIHREQDIFTFQSLDSTKTWILKRSEILNNSITIYIKTDPVPFTYTIDEARAKQEGGFYPSVYSGVSGATMLTPLIARQVMRMYDKSNNTRKTRRRKSKKLSRNKRA
jgi:hypothetical protein